jgi:hypothetical protein
MICAVEYFFFEETISGQNELRDGMGYETKRLFYLEVGVHMQFANEQRSVNDMSGHRKKAKFLPGQQAAMHHPKSQFPASHIRDRHEDLFMRLKLQILKEFINKRCMYASNSILLILHCEC